MSKTPPPLSSESADKMASVVEAADALVDAGESPDAALAKAANEYALPVGHVPLVVRAFNTSRAVRQLGETDVWAKAADYPTASEDGVRKALTAPATATAMKSASVSDYYLPPDHKPLAVETVALTKRASAPVTEKKAEHRSPVDGRDPALALQFAAAKAYDKVAAALTELNPSEYLGVRDVASRLYPDAAAFVFPHYESLGLRKLASARPSPLVGVDHPVVVLIGELDAVKKAYAPVAVPPPPEGYRKVASEAGATLYQKLAKHPILGIEIRPTVTLPPPPPPGPTGFSISYNPPAKKEAADPTGGGFVSGFKGWGGTALSPLKKLTSSVITGPAMQSLRAEEPKATGGSSSASAIGSSGTTLQSNLRRLDEQTSIQSLLEDPRFSKADPRTVVQTYQQLAQIAPMSMANPAIAADYVNRRLLTGPPSVFDLEMITKIEKNLSAIRRQHAGEAEEE